MTRLTIALVACALAACPAGKKPDTAGPGSAAEPALQPKKLIVSWGITPVGELADIFLATTDETGKQVSHSVGRYKGNCEKFSPAKEMSALTGVKCASGAGGTELHAVHRGDQIVVVQMGITPGVAPDPMSRQEIQRVPVPVGIGVEAAP